MINYEKAIMGFEEYLLGREKANKTVEAYVGKVSQFNRYLLDLNISFLNVTHSIASNYIIQINGKTSTKNAHILGLKPFYTWLNEFNHIQDNPFENVKCLKNKKKLSDKGVIFPEDKLDKLIDILQNPSKYCYSYSKNTVKRNLAMILLGSSIGLRRNDYRNIKIEDIDFENSSFRVIRKGSKSVVLPLEPKVSIAIKDYIDNERNSNSSALFVGINGEELSEGGVGELIKKLLLKSGAEEIYCHSHSLRHTAAIKMIKRGISLWYIKELMSHESIQTTEIYARISNEDARQQFMKGL